MTHSCCDVQGQFKLGDGSSATVWLLVLMPTLSPRVPVCLQVLFGSNLSRLVDQTCSACQETRAAVLAASLGGVPVAANGTVPEVLLPDGAAGTPGPLANIYIPMYPRSLNRTTQGTAVDHGDSSLHPTCVGRSEHHVHRLHAHACFVACRVSLPTADVSSTTLDAECLGVVQVVIRLSAVLERLVDDDDFNAVISDPKPSQPTAALDDMMADLGTCIVGELCTMALWIRQGA